MAWLHLAVRHDRAKCLVADWKEKKKMLQKLKKINSKKVTSWEWSQRFFLVVSKLFSRYFSYRFVDSSSLIALWFSRIIFWLLVTCARCFHRNKNWSRRGNFFLIFVYKVLIQISLYFFFLWSLFTFSSTFYNHDNRERKQKTFLRHLVFSGIFLEACQTTTKKPNSFFCILRIPAHFLSERDF